MRSSMTTGKSNILMVTMMMICLSVFFITTCIYFWDIFFPWKHRNPAKPAIKCAGGGCQPNGYKSDLGSPSGEQTHDTRVRREYHHTSEFRRSLHRLRVRGWRFHHLGWVYDCDDHVHHSVFSSWEQFFFRWVYTVCPAYSKEDKE